MGKGEDAERMDSPEDPCLGHAVKNCMTVICKCRWGAIAEDIRICMLSIIGRRYVRRFFCFLL